MNARSTIFQVGLSLLYLTAMSPADSAEIEEVQIDRDGSRYILVSTTRFDAPPEQIFNVLIDYDDLADLSKTIKESRHLKPDAEGNKIVFTRIGACVFFFCRTVEKTEYLEFTRPVHIQTIAIPERSNVRYSRSEWTLKADEHGGTSVVFRLEFEPDFWIPPLIGPVVIKHALKSDGASAVNRIDARALELSRTQADSDI